MGADKEKRRQKAAFLPSVSCFLGSVGYLPFTADCLLFLLEGITDANPKDIR